MLAFTLYNHTPLPPLHNHPQPPPLRILQVPGSASSATVQLTWDKTSETPKIAIVQGEGGARKQESIRPANGAVVRGVADVEVAANVPPELTDVCALYRCFMLCMCFLCDVMGRHGVV